MINTTTHNEYHLEADYKRWEILLSTLKNENSFLILKLSEVLERNGDKEFVSKAEYFQNEFITKDEFIKDLERDIRYELKLLENNRNNHIPVKFIKKHEKLKNEIKYFESNFYHLKNEFDKCVQP